MTPSKTTTSSKTITIRWAILTKDWLYQSFNGPTIIQAGTEWPISGPHSVRLYEEGLPYNDLTTIPLGYLRFESEVITVTTTKTRREE